MKLKAITLQEFIDFCQEHSELTTIFNSEGWMKMFAGELICFGLIDNESKLLGGFYLFEDRIKGFKFYRNPPFTPHNGFIFINKAENPARKLSNFKRAMSLVARKLDHLAKRGIVTISFPQEVLDTQPLIWKNIKVVPHYSYVHDLTVSEESIFSRIATETRNRIRKAEQDGLKTRREFDPQKAMSLIEQTLRKKHAHNEGKWLRIILNSFLNSANSIMLFTEKDGVPLSVNICVHDQRAAYYILGGLDQQTDHTGAGRFGLWETIKAAREIGLQKFDFEGSMIPGVESFFRSFGGDLVPYFTANKASFWKEVLLKRTRRNKF